MCSIGAKGLEIGAKAETEGLDLVEILKHFHSEASKLSKMLETRDSNFLMP